MASGTPVITSNATSLPEIAGEAGIVINPDRAEEIAKALLCPRAARIPHRSRPHSGFKFFLARLCAGHTR